MDRPRKRRHWSEADAVFSIAERWKKSYLCGIIIEKEEVFK